MYCHEVKRRRSSQCRPRVCVESQAEQDARGEPACCLGCHFDYEEKHMLPRCPPGVAQMLRREHDQLRAAGFPKAAVEAHAQREMVFFRQFCTAEQVGHVEKDHAAFAAGKYDGASGSKVGTAPGDNRYACCPGDEKTGCSYCEAGQLCRCEDAEHPQHGNYVSCSCLDVGERGASPADLLRAAMMPAHVAARIAAINAIQNGGRPSTRQTCCGSHPSVGKFCATCDHKTQDCTCTATSCSCQPRI